MSGVVEKTSKVGHLRFLKRRGHHGKTEGHAVD